jgi:hypothetical protein
VTDAVDLAGKVVAFLAALLGLAGYVLLLGAAIVWLRLNQVDLPPDLSVSLAAREELIVIGAQAVAVWVVFATALGGLAAWIVTGDPERRRFDVGDAGLALAVTLAIVFALDSESISWLVSLPGIAVAIVIVGALFFWPSDEAVMAVALPVAVALALGLALSFLSPGNEIATAAGASFIFGALVLLAPPLQEWRARQEANRTALSLLEAEADSPGRPPAAIRVALERREPENAQSQALLWIKRSAVAFTSLLILGVVSVTSQVDRDQDFHKALVSLSNGDCVAGTYITRGKDQLIIAEPNWTGDEKTARIAVIPTKEVLEVQVYSDQGSKLVPKRECAEDKAIIVHGEPVSQSP